MKINIQNLRNGFHTFEFTTTTDSINLEGNNIIVNDIKIKSSVEKREDNIIVTTQVRTQANFVCDKCLDNFAGNLEDEFTLIYTSDRETAKLGKENIVLLQPHTQEIDLKQEVREILLLAIPMKVICSEKCKGLCPTCGTNLNIETCQCVQRTFDPRWEELKKLQE